MPVAVDRREHLPRQRAGHPRADRLEPDATREAAQLLERVGLRENPVTRVTRHRRRQAAAGRDRQGAVQGGPAADPRRADRGAQRRGLRSTCWTCCAGCGTRASPASSSRTSSTRSRRSPTASRSCATARTIETLDMSATTVDRGPHHPRHGRPRPRPPVPAAHADDRRGGAARSRTGPCTAPPRSGGSWSSTGQPHRAPRRDRRHRRPDGRRPHRARDERLRPSLRHGHLRPGAQGRRGDPRSAPCGEAIEHGIAYVTEDRKRYGLNLIEDIKRNVSAAALGKLASRGGVDEQRGDTRSPTSTATQHEHQGARASSRSPASCRAATSRRSCCRSGSSPTPTC